MELHWLPVAPGSKFKSLLLTYRVTAGFATSYLSHLVRAGARTRWPSSGKAACTDMPIQTLLLLSFPMVEQPPNLCQSRSVLLLLQKEDTVLLTASTLLTVLF